MPYDKGPHPIELPSDLVHELEGSALDTVSFAKRELPAEWFDVMETVLNRQEAAAKAIRKAQDPRAVK